MSSHHHTGWPLAEVSRASRKVWQNGQQNLNTSAAQRERETSDGAYFTLARATAGNVATLANVLLWREGSLDVSGSPMDVKIQILSKCFVRTREVASAEANAEESAGI